MWKPNRRSESLRRQELFSLARLTDLIIQPQAFIDMALLTWCARGRISASGKDITASHVMFLKDGLGTTGIHSGGSDHGMITNL